MRTFEVGDVITGNPKTFTDKFWSNKLVQIRDSSTPSVLILDGSKWNGKSFYYLEDEDNFEPYYINVCKMTPLIRLLSKW